MKAKSRIEGPEITNIKRERKEKKRKEELKLKLSSMTDWELQLSTRTTMPNGDSYAISSIYSLPSGRQEENDLWPPAGN